MAEQNKKEEDVLKPAEVGSEVGQQESAKGAAGPADKSVADVKASEDSNEPAYDLAEDGEVGWEPLVAEKRPRTSDEDDPGRSWTVQEAHEERKDKGKRKANDPVVLAEPTPAPGQVFTEDELPDRKVVEASGIDYDNWVAGLPVVK